MYAIIIRRLILLPIMLLIAGFLIFLLPVMTGIDPARAVLRARIGQRELTEETIAQYRAEVGLDQPLPIQYFSWLRQLARGDLGYSYVFRTPITDILFPAIKITATLSASAVLVAFLISIPLGVFAAVRPGRSLDTIIATVSQTGVAIPEFWLAPILILVFALYLGWLPSAGWRGPLFAILPVMTLALRPIAYFTRLTRAAMLEVLNRDYIRAARARGLTKTQTIWRHALRNALIPVVTLAALWLANLLGGAVIIEVIFSIPGVGRTLFGAVTAVDLPLLQGGLILIVGLAVIVNSLTDITYIILNPAIGLEQP
jgi:peptide/nickel transport system permease protein